MHVRTDYETEDILAVFQDPEVARHAARRVRELLKDPRRVVVVPLEPGRYALADMRLQEVIDGAVRAARLSVPLGAALGAALAAVAVPGVGAVALTGLALAGALAGLIVGGMTGAISRTRWDRDAAGGIDVPPNQNYMLVVVHASPAPARRETSRVIGELKRAGALGFLDATAYYASKERERLIPA